MSKLWFKRKTYGWGWYPATWQGWLITLVYIIAIVGFSLTIDTDSPTREILFTFILPVVLLTIAFIRIAKKKGESPKWQWGTRKDKRLVIGILYAMALTALLGSYFLNEFHKRNKIPNEQGAYLCTGDGFICEDGTPIGRTGPNCEFVCPGQ